VDDNNDSSLESDQITVTQEKTVQLTSIKPFIDQKYENIEIKDNKRENSLEEGKKRDKGLEEFLAKNNSVAI
jgi:hypothetical protein